ACATLAHLQATLRVGPRSFMLGSDTRESELGASKLASSSTPTPNRSTNSPPSQAVTRAIAIATKESTIGAAPGAAGEGSRKYQSTTKSTTTTTFPSPCHKPIDLARVPLGIASQ